VWEDEMAGGNLIAESIRVGASVEAPLSVERMYRVGAWDETVGQPRVWTFIAFEVPDDEAASLADALSEALDQGLVLRLSDCRRDVRGLRWTHVPLPTGIGMPAPRPRIGASDPRPRGGAMMSCGGFQV
jgi:hypothetical protein